MLHPYLERAASRPRAVLGMLGMSARLHVPEGALTFAVPMNTLVRMVEDMDESLIITHSGEKIRKRSSFKNVWQSFHKKHVKMKQ